MNGKRLTYHWFRFSLRTLLILVTVVAVGCWLFVRQRSFSLRAEKHAASLTNIEQDLKFSYVPSAGWNTSKEDLQRQRREDQEREAVLRSQAIVHENLVKKYRRAARYPWLLVAKDPPGVRYHFSYFLEIENGKGRWVPPPLFADEVSPEDLTFDLPQESIPYKSSP